MPDALTLVATFTAGLLSFLAPCTVPLLPAYLSCVSGIGAAELMQGVRPGRARARLVLGTLLFVSGFAVVFVMLGIGAGGLGHTVRDVARPVEIAGGVLMVMLGLVLSGVLSVAPLERQLSARLPQRLEGAGLYAALPLGVVFGIGWTPCVGPYLASALTLAAVGAHAGTGALLLGVYAAGLGTPFIAVALLCASLPDVQRFTVRMAPVLARAGGVVLVVLGVLLATGEYARLTSVLAGLYTPGR